MAAHQTMVQALLALLFFSSARAVTLPSEGKSSIQNVRIVAVSTTPAAGGLPSENNTYVMDVNAFGLILSTSVAYLNVPNTFVATQTISAQDASGYSLSVSSGISAQCINLQGGQVCGPGSGGGGTPFTGGNVPNVTTFQAGLQTSTAVVTSTLTVLGSDVNGQSASFKYGVSVGSITASSATLTATGNAQYSLQTSSGISIASPGMLVAPGGVNAPLYGNATTANSATTATNIAGGAAGQVQVQSAAGATTFIPGMANGGLAIGAGTSLIPSTGTLTGTANQITVTNGVGSITLATPQNIHTGASPTFVAGTLTGLSSNTVVYVNASTTTASLPQIGAGGLVIGTSIGAAPSTGTLTGTTNRVTVTNGAGTITLSGPQDLATASAPQFAGMALTGPYTNTSTSSILGADVNGMSAKFKYGVSVGSITASSGTFTATGTTQFSVVTSSGISLPTAAPLCWGSQSPANCMYAPASGASLSANNTFTGNNTFQSSTTMSGSTFHNGTTLFGSGTTVSTFSATGQLQLVAGATISANGSMYLSTSATSNVAAIAITGGATVYLAVGSSTMTWSPGYCVVVDTIGASDSQWGVKIATMNSGGSNTVVASVTIPPNLLNKKGMGLTMTCAAHANTSGLIGIRPVICGTTPPIVTVTPAAGASLKSVTKLLYFIPGQQNYQIDEQINPGLTEEYGPASGTTIACDTTVSDVISCGLIGDVTGRIVFDWMQVCYQ